MAKMRKGSKQKVKLKVVVFGEHGSRKSGFLADFAKMKNEDGSPMKVLYVDAETESLSGYHIDRLEEEGVDLENLLILEPDSTDELIEILKKVQEKEPFYEYDEDGDETNEEVLDSEGKTFFPDVVVIDSVSALVQDIKKAIRAISKIRAKVKASKSDTMSSLEKMVAEKTAGIELKDYDTIKGVGEGLVSELVRKLDTHVGIVCRSKAEKKNLKSGASIQLVDTGRQVLDSWDFLRYEVNTVIEMKKEEDERGIVTRVYGVIDSKDRTGQFSQGEIIENPTICLWQPVIEKNRNRAEGNYKNRLSEEEKIDKVISKGIKEVEEKTMTVKEYAIAMRDIIAGATAEQKKSLIDKIKPFGINPKDITSGNITLEQAQKIYPIFETVAE